MVAHLNHILQELRARGLGAEQLARRMGMNENLVASMLAVLQQGGHVVSALVDWGSEENGYQRRIFYLSKRARAAFDKNAPRR
jgi:hypothetical protein